MDESNPPIAVKGREKHGQLQQRLLAQRSRARQGIELGAQRGRNLVVGGVNLQHTLLTAIGEQIIGQRKVPQVLGTDHD